MPAGMTVTVPFPTLQDALTASKVKARLLRPARDRRRGRRARSHHRSAERSRAGRVHFSLGAADRRRRDEHASTRSTTRIRPPGAAPANGRNVFPIYEDFTTRDLERSG